MFVIYISMKIGKFQNSSNFFEIVFQISGHIGGFKYII